MQYYSAYAISELYKVKLKQIRHTNKGGIMRHTHKNVLRISAASLLAGIGCLALAQPSYAVSTGTFNDDNGTTWAYEYNTDGDDPVLTIGFKAAASSTSATLSIPSLSEVKGKLSSLSAINTIDTYFIKQLVANDASGVVTPNMTKIDMTNAAKVQMVSLAPLFGATTGEVELVFGDDMVIGDPQGYKSGTGLFEGLNIKLTNLNKVKYIGWDAFRNATLNEASRNITINSNQSLGGYVFYGSNVKSLTIDAEDTGEGFCENCTDLTSLSFGNNAKRVYGNAFRGTTALNQTLNTNKLVELGRAAFESSGIAGVQLGSSLTTIYDEVFRNTNLGSLDLTGVTASMGNWAFANANISTLNMGETIDNVGNWAFYKNNITNLTMPKSIKKLGVSAFYNNPMDTLTINFDIADLGNVYGGKYYSGSSSGFHLRTLFGCNGGQWLSCTADWHDEEGYYDTALNLKHLIVNAPYAADDTTAPNHYYEYSNDSGSEYILNLRGTAKNIIPARFFADLDGLESVVIGEGYELIDSQAFMRGCTNHLGDGPNYRYCPGYGGTDWRYTKDGSILTTVSLPSTLKAIGDKAFMWFSNNQNFRIDALPENLEYIGQQAFFMNAGTIGDLKSRKIKIIGDHAFYAGIKVDKIYLGDSLEYIGQLAFGGNKGELDLTVDTDLFGRDIRYGNEPFRNTFGLWLANPYIDTNYLQNVPAGFTNRPSDTSPMSHNHHFKSIVFTNKAATEPSGQYNQFLEGVVCDYVDLSATPWKNIESVAFQFIEVGELKLPSKLEVINGNAFVGAKIEEELILPDTLKELGSLAFMSQANGTTIGDVKVTKLPQSLEVINSLAFYKQSRVKLDVNLPNLTVLGYGAFAGTRVRDIVFNNKLESVGADVVYDVPTLRNITIDVNLYDTSIYNGWYSSLKDGHYGVFAWAFNTPKQGRFGTIKLTSNAGMPCDEFGNCQALAEAANQTCKDNDDNDIDCDRKMAFFYGIEARTIDLSELQGMTTVGASMFQNTTISEVILPETITTIGEGAFFNAKIGKINLPDTVETIEDEAFQWTKGKVSGYVVPAGTKTIGRSAFYGSDLTDDLYIPAGVESIGEDAFNAGDEDVHYDTVSIEGDIDETITSDKLIHQLFWNADISTLIIHSSTLPKTTDNGNSDRQQFWNMPMSEVVITALPAIPDNAFEANSNLKLLVMRRDSALRSIGEEAFLDCENLHDVKFSDALANETVTLGKNAFSNTGFETIGDEDAQFELNDAKFDASAGYTFANMKKLTSVHIPESFNNAIVPEGIFANASELTEVTVAPGVDTIKSTAFTNDQKLERIILWGDTIIEDTSLSGYTAPTRSALSSISGPTIPTSTNIYAYTGAKSQEYADARSGEGKFYPLDEVLYITTDKYRLTQPTDEDFGGNVTVYALRRDGIVMESDTWGEYSGTAYPRADKDLYFMHEAATVEADPAFGTVFETPISVNNLDFSNENFTNISYAVGDANEDGDRYTTIIYTDKVTSNDATTSVLLRAPVVRRAAPTVSATPEGGRGEGEDGSTPATTSGNTATSSAPASSTTTNSSAANAQSSAQAQAGGQGSETQTAPQTGSSESATVATTGGSEGETATTGETVTANNESSEDAQAEATAQPTAKATTEAEGTSNPKTGDTILGYIALLGSCSLFAGAGVAIIRRNRR